jgi:hypothetical protein
MAPWTVQQRAVCSAGCSFQGTLRNRAENHFRALAETCWLAGGGDDIAGEDTAGEDTTGAWCSVVRRI